MTDNALVFLAICGFAAAAFGIACWIADLTSPPVDLDEFDQPTHVRLLTDQEPRP